MKLDLLFWNDFFSLALGIFYLFLAGLTYYYRRQEVKNSALRWFRILTMVILTSVGLFYLALSLFDSTLLPRIVRAGLITKGLWAVVGFWVVSQLWISHDIMSRIEGNRGRDVQ